MLEVPVLCRDSATRKNHFLDPLDPLCQIVSVMVGWRVLYVQHQSPVCQANAPQHYELIGLNGTGKNLISFLFGKCNKNDDGGSTICIPKFLALPICLLMCIFRTIRYTFRCSLSSKRRLRILEKLESKFRN